MIIRGPQTFRILLPLAFAAFSVQAQDANADIDKMLTATPGPYYIVADTINQVVSSGAFTRAMRMPRNGSKEQLWNIIKEGGRYKLQNVGTGAFLSMAFNGWYGGSGTVASFVFRYNGNKLVFVENTKNEFFTLGSDGGYVRWAWTGTGQQFTFEPLPPPPTVTKVVNANVNVQASQGGTVTAKCPAGSFVLSGGALTNNSAYGVWSSGPGPTNDTWVAAYSPLTQVNDGATIGAYAICGNAPGYEIVRGNTTATPACTPGKTAIGGGGSFAQMTGSYRYPAGTGWTIEGRQGAATAAAAICTTYPLVNVIATSATGRPSLGGTLRVAAACPAGQVLIGGGTTTADGGLLALNGSAPGDGNVFNPGNNTQWIATFTVYSPYGDGTQKAAQASAICVPAAR